MAYTPINAADIVAGKPTKEEIFTTIRSNQESFNTDIEALKQTSTIDIFDVKYSGDINNYSLTEVNDRQPVFKSPVGLTIVSFVMTLLEASTSGTLEVDLEKSTDNGVNWSTLLTTPVQLTGTTVGSVSGSVSWIDVPSQSINQNDLLRVKISGLQTGQGTFHVSIYGELS